MFFVALVAPRYLSGLAMLHLLLHLVAPCCTSLFIWIYLSRVKLKKLRATNATSYNKLNSVKSTGATSLRCHARRAQHHKRSKINRCNKAQHHKFSQINRCNKVQQRCNITNAVKSTGATSATSATIFTSRLTNLD